MEKIYIFHNKPDLIKVTFPYHPILVNKIKKILGYQWHPAEKHWSFPNKNDILAKILKVFGVGEVHIDPALQKAITFLKPNSFTIAPDKIKMSLPQWKEGKSLPRTCFGDVGVFENLKGLISRKYSYKTVKGFLYCNKEVRQDKKPLREFKSEGRG